MSTGYNLKPTLYGGNIICIALLESKGWFSNERAGVPVRTECSRHRALNDKDAVLRPYLATVACAQPTI